MFVNLRNTYNDQIIRTKVGFSWTVFFWGAFVPLFRKDIKAFAIMLPVFILAGYLLTGIASIAVDVAAGFFYNNNYIQRLLADGYIPADETDKTILKNANIKF